MESYMWAIVIAFVQFISFQTSSMLLACVDISFSFIDE